ncbi:MAG: CPBP family intramembrane metalloprotease [Xanthobacteraceae bacterium]|nr:CPBP family intramembrane metalloprotease [Xanthobacteraceae bacterium]
MSLDTDRSPQPPPNRPPTNPPWGVGATLAWTVTAFAVSMLIATAVFGLWSAGRPRPVSSAYDGVVITIGTVVSVPVQIAVLSFAAQLRRWPAAVYLGLVVPRRAEVIVAVVAVIALNLTFDAILYVSGRDIVPPFQVEVWRSAAEAGWLLPLIVAIVVVAPIGEEVAFRGFLFRGWGKPGWEMHAVAAIALAWALLHIQYDWLGMAQIFVAGLVLGWFRWATGSTILTIGMHILVNCQSMLETWIKMEFFP